MLHFVKIVGIYHEILQLHGKEGRSLTKTHVHCKCGQSRNGFQTVEGELFESWHIGKEIKIRTHETYF